jgi:hypothetical protein
VTDDRRAELRAEVLRQLRWQQQQWQQVIAQAPPRAPVLTSPQDREWFHGCLDVLRDAGEEVPQTFYRRGSVIPKSHEAGRETASISLTALVADVTRALAYFSEEADDDPGAPSPRDERC